MAFPRNFRELGRAMLVLHGRSPTLVRRARVLLRWLTFGSLALGILAEAAGWPWWIWAPLFLVVALKEALDWLTEHTKAPVSASIWADIDNQAKARGAHMRAVLLHCATHPNQRDNHRPWHLQRTILQHVVREFALRLDDSEDNLSASWSVPQADRKGFTVVARNRENSEPARVEGVTHAFKSLPGGEACPGAATAAKTRQPSVVGDTHKHGQCFDEASTAKYRSFLAVPVYIPDKDQNIVGFLSVDHHSEPDKFAPAHAFAIDDVAYLLAICETLKE